FYVCIRGEDVTLEKGRAEQSSARNHLRGTIREIAPAGILTKVMIDAGFELVALVTRQAAADLELKKGSEIFAVFKASAVHLIPKKSCWSEFGGAERNGGSTYLRFEVSRARYGASSGKRAAPRSDSERT